MSSRRPNNSNASRADQIGEEAGGWLQRLGDQIDPQDPIPDPQERQQAFFAWIEQSAEHVQIFYEMMRVEQLLSRVDPQRSIRIEDLLARRLANVVHLRGSAETSPTSQPSTVDHEAPSRRYRKLATGLAAAVVTLACGALLSLVFFDRHSYSTGIGEQRSVKLDDGSFVVLNTDSHMEVQFSDQERRVELIRGEALFTVAHNSSRPFVVSSGGTKIRAVGTQFDVRRWAEATDVSVVEGVVQIAAASGREPAAGAAAEKATPPTRLVAGEEARVTRGRVNKEQYPNVENALLWRKRRLVFTDTPLEEVAAEFNHYNRTKIRVEGAIAKQKQLSGIFDADRPTAVIGYAMKDDSLSVTPDGGDWVIREHTADEP